MKSRETCFDIHSLVKFRICSARKHVSTFRDIDMFFSYFECDNLSNPDIVLNIGKFEPSNKGTFVVDNKYFVKENYFYCRDRDKRAQWEVEILGFERGCATINFHGRIAGIEECLIPDYLAQNLVLRPLIELRLLDKGYVVVHGLGLEAEGRAHVLAARGGAHKTRIAMDAARAGGFRILGDDRVIFGSNRQVLSYPLFPSLVTFRVDRLTDEYISSVGAKTRLLLSMLASRTAKQAGGYFSDRGKIENVFLASRSTTPTTATPILIESNEAAKRLVRSSQMEMLSSGIRSLGFLHFLSYMTAYSYVFPCTGIGKYWSTMEEMLSEYLKGIPVFGIELPLNYDTNVLSSLKGCLRGAWDG